MKENGNMVKHTQVPEGGRELDDDYGVHFLDRNIEFGGQLKSLATGQKDANSVVLQCDTCGVNNETEPWLVWRIKGGERTLCVDHWYEARQECNRRNLAEAAKTLLADVDGWVTRRLIASGMRPLELSASLEKIPKPVADAIANHAPEAMRAMVFGSYPNQGYGLVGIARIGKTMALASMMRQTFSAYLKRKAPLVGYEVKGDGFQFVSWPHECAKWRMDWVGQDSWKRDKMVKDLSTKPFVFLDDLGREGMANGRTYSDDPCALLLADIIGERHAHGRPMIWTSNLDPDDLADYYGPATYERLAQLAPPIEIRGASSITGTKHPVVD